jgi:hypothetical protein
MKFKFSATKYVVSLLLFFVVPSCAFVYDNAVENDTGTAQVDLSTATATAFDSDTDIDSGMNTDSNTDTGSEIDIESDVDTDIDTDTHAVLDSGTVTDTNLNTDTDTSTDSDSDGDTPSEADSGSDTETTTGMDTDTDTGADSNSDADTLSEADVGSDTETTTGMDTDVDADSEVDTSTEASVELVYEQEFRTDIGDIQLRFANNLIFSEQPPSRVPFSFIHDDGVFENGCVEIEIPFDDGASLQAVNVGFSLTGDNMDLRGAVITGYLKLFSGLSEQTSTEAGVAAMYIRPKELAQDTDDDTATVVYTDRFILDDDPNGIPPYFGRSDGWIAYSFDMNEVEEMYSEIDLSHVYQFGFYIRNSHEKRFTNTTAYIRFDSFRIERRHLIATDY